MLEKYIVGEREESPSDKVEVDGQGHETLAEGAKDKRNEDQPTNEQGWPTYDKRRWIDNRQKLEEKTDRGLKREMKKENDEALKNCT